ncbi:MATE family efflux transporter [Butyrivibrio sp. AE2032]|uniref:MATE family efflux transporter n=1 Tax=Butyrivibrio sp. AE2032 TaxID=1458463 RepID=UPI00068AB9DC|nr:MATE family efflux transporter [Butyrivibrio sp. AE2032]
MKSNITDMTQGSPTRHILMFALPTLIGNVFQQIYNLADSMIVGNVLGSEAFAAVGATSSITFLFFALCNGIGSGGGVVVSQYYGAHDDSNVRKCIVNTGLIMPITPVLFGLTVFFLSPLLLKLLATPDNIMTDAVLYTRFMCVGLLFVSLYNYLSSMLKALGDSKSPLYFLIVSTIINDGFQGRASRCPDVVAVRSHRGIVNGSPVRGKRLRHYCDHCIYGNQQDRAVFRKHPHQFLRFEGR